MWETVKDVLDDNGIFIASLDKNEGRITTEYVEGQSQANALGFLGVISTRYRYFISIEKKATATQRVRITARLESSGDALQQWRDISSDNKAITTKLENWLYEQIEKSL
jgi:uncharacterized lipoprotein